LGTSLRPTAGNNRTRIAQPDIAEGLDNHFRKGSQSVSHVGCGLIGRNKPNLFSRSLGVNGGRERCDFRLRGREVVFPKVGSAWKTDPNGLVRCPFRNWKLAHALAR
jgi:hypothetical protein